MPLARQISQCEEDGEKDGDNPQERVAQVDVPPVRGLWSYQFNADIAFRSRRDIRGTRRATLDEWGQIAPCRWITNFLIRGGTVIYARPVLQLAIYQYSEGAIRVGHGIGRMQVGCRDFARSDPPGHRVNCRRQDEVRSPGEVRPCCSVRPADEGPRNGNGEDGADQSQGQSSTQWRP